MQCARRQPLRFSCAMRSGPKGPRRNAEQGVECDLLPAPGRATTLRDTDWYWYRFVPRAFAARICTGTNPCRDPSRHGLVPVPLRAARVPRAGTNPCREGSRHGPVLVPVRAAHLMARTGAGTSERQPEKLHRTRHTPHYDTVL
jgi:hypothetical protein